MDWSENRGKIEQHALLSEISREITVNCVWISLSNSSFSQCTLILSWFFSIYPIKSLNIFGDFCGDFRARVTAVTNAIMMETVVTEGADHYYTGLVVSRRITFSVRRFANRCFPERRFQEHATESNCQLTYVRRFSVSRVVLRLIYLNRKKLLMFCPQWLSVCCSLRQRSSLIMFTSIQAVLSRQLQKLSLITKRGVASSVFMRWRWRRFLWGSWRRYTGTCLLTVSGAKSLACTVLTRQRNVRINHVRKLAWSKLAIGYKRRPWKVVRWDHIALSTEKTSLRERDFPGNHCKRSPVTNGKRL